jgi:hypothetical protein
VIGPVEEMVDEVAEREVRSEYGEKGSSQQRDDELLASGGAGLCKKTFSQSAGLAVDPGGRPERLRCQECSMILDSCGHHKADMEKVVIEKSNSSVASQ